MSNIEELNKFTTRDTIRITEENHLEIGGVDTVDLANKYGTPLVIYDIETVRKNIRSLKEGLSAYKVKTEVSYASKAFSSVALYQIIEQEDISIDVVSGGELYLAKQAGFPAKRINFHGNNKSLEELRAALDYNIGNIIVDNFHELDMLDVLTKEHQKETDIIIRITPGVSADTHRYIMTGQADSKFGFDLQSGQAEDALLKALESEYLNVNGLHMHIGSQIFDTKSYAASMNQILSYVRDWCDKYKFEFNIFNIGGGFGIQHTAEEAENSPKEQLSIISQELMRLLDEYNLPYPELWIEPGRSIVGEAGTTIYKIGSQKNLPDIRHYVSVDGGMSDNIRPAFYNAKYTGFLANRMRDEADTTVSVAGKACESGDMLIFDLPLPEANPGDLLAVINTGDYTFAMASNYNRIPRPAVIFVENGKEFLAIRRETPEDFMRFENFLPENN